MNNLRRILDLAKRTGDRVIITDPDGEDAFVVMGLDQYEGLLDGKPKSGPVQPKTTVLPPKRTIDDGPRLRQDRDRRPAETPDLDDSAPPDLFDLMKPAGDSGDTWDLGKMSEAEREEVLRQFAAYQEETANPAPKSPQSKAQNDDLNEDQFYLEPIE